MLSACAVDDDGLQQDFVLDNPAGPGDGRGESPADGGAGTGGEDSGDDGGDGGREVSEADIVFVEGDRLYALSAYSGLVVVDVSAPDQRLPVLGRYRLPGQPFEMYVDGGQVFAMLSDYGTYEWDQDSAAYAWQSSSRLVALDASDPAQITQRGDFAMPGWIQDSRRVGDVLYLVTWEDGWCWGCADQQPRTVVTSLDVANPAAVEVVDQLEFDNQTDDEWDWSGPRSVSSTDERMYVGGQEYSGWEDAHSVIDVIDISDPGGALVAGAKIEVAGAINSRWQMDEHDGALRVISQPWTWRSNDPPVVETFTVASAAQVTPLASLPMTLPRPESLQSVRFDGTRAYAITFEQTDPLFTLDLTDPAAPQQLGELEIPGWVHHMEPRGDRILALGFDRGHPDGSINVSLFDVEDLADPQLLSRVNFGGDWASFAEDQNRIHKAFSIVAEQGLLLVPFSGWEYDESQFDEWGCGRYQSGIQIVDWADDALGLRGVAPSQGAARRALMHRDRLLALSDQSVQAFDIADRDNPVRSASVAIAANVSDVAVDDGLVVRLSNDWWTNEAALEVVPASAADVAEPLGRLLLRDDTDDSVCNYGGPVEVFLHNRRAYLLQETYGPEDGGQKLTLTTIDVRDPAAPTLVGSLELPFARGYGGWGLGLETRESNAVLLGDALLLTSFEDRYSGERYLGARGRVNAIDLSQPDEPRVSAPINRPDAATYGNLRRFGDTVVSWHTRPLAGDESRVRFFLERFNAEGDAVQAREPVNVPGQVVFYDDGSARAVTVGFSTETVDLNDAECWSHSQAWDYRYPDGGCVLAHRPLHLLAVDSDSARLLSTLDVEGDDARLSAVAASTDRLFATVRVGGSAWAWGAAEDGAVGGPEGSEPDIRDEAVVITGHMGNGLVESGRATVSRGLQWSSLVGVSGSRLVFSRSGGLGTVDASDPSAPEVTVVPSFGWGCWNAEVVDNTVYCPMGPWGLQVLPLP